jgi:hypothetical protein
MTFEEAMEFGHSLPVSLRLSSVTGKPLMSRAEWEQLPRGRRLRDVLLARQPPKGYPFSGAGEPRRRD